MNHLHPTLAAALRPFTPRAPQDELSSFLRLPFELYFGDELVNAHPDDVRKACEECLDSEERWIEERVLVLTMERRERDADMARVDFRSAA